MKNQVQERFAEVLELPMTYFYIKDDDEARSVLEASRSDKPVKLQKAIKKLLEGK